MNLWTIFSLEMRIWLFTQPKKGKNCYTLYDKKIDKVQYITNTRNAGDSDNVEMSLKNISQIIYLIYYMNQVI